jgi:hypothetical protein
MAEKNTSIPRRIREAVSGPRAAAGPPPEPEQAAATRRGLGGMEEVAAAVALAIDRERRASRSLAPAFRGARAAGPDEWAMSGRLAQVERLPARDPWNR